MAISKFTKDMAIIAALDDEPNDVGGLSGQQLKEKFDEAGTSIKSYLNNTLTTEIDANLATKDELNQVVAGISPDLQAAAEILSKM